MPRKLLVQIDKGVPIPPPRMQRRRHGWPITAMEIGDSVFMPGQKSRGSPGYWRKMTGFTFTARKVDGGVRFWRVA